MPCDLTAQWTVLAIDLSACVQKYTRRTYGCLKALQVCAAVHLRAVWTSDTVYTPQACTTAILNHMSHHDRAHRERNVPKTFFCCFRAAGASAATCSPADTATRVLDAGGARGALGRSLRVALGPRESHHCVGCAS